ncbi:MAG: penicillin-binding protein activator [Proteobacteria bacterium]|nr:penicillin-binding protein activator [Pseudomonadota bacterium]
MDDSRILGGGIYPEVQEIQPGASPDAETALAVPPDPGAPALRRPVSEAAAPINVAILLPLSGANARVGNALLNAAQMALFDVGGQNLVLWPKDTEGTPEGAARAVEAALQDGAELILGPLFSGSVRAAAESARERGVNVVAFSNDRTVAGDGVFLMGFMPEQQVDRVVNFARTQGITRFAALLPETPFGATVEDALRAAIARGGGDLVRVERYFTDVQDFQDPVQRVADYGRRSGLLRAARRDLEHRNDEISKRTLKRLANLDTIGELGYEALFIAEGGARMRAIAPLLPFYDVDPDIVRFLGTRLWEDPAFGREPAMVGAWFAGPSPEAAESFRARYAALYGAATPRVASLAYDATALAAVLSRAAERPYFTSDALRNQNGFVGIDGIFRFDEEGIAQRGLAVIEIRPKDFQVISSAPESFQEAIN